MLLMMWFLSGFSFRISSRFFKLGGFFKGIYYLVSYILKLAGNNFIEKFGLFFKNKAAMENFKAGNLKFAAQASAVIVTEGASVDRAYNKGVA